MVFSQPSTALCFIAADGIQWTVREDAREPPSLIFDSPASVRRVRHYPADWRGLGSDALAELSWEK